MEELPAACTDAERRAANRLHDRLRAAGHEAWVETVWVRPRWAWSVALHCALAAMGEDDFPTLLVMDYLKGKEHTVDAICRGGRFLVGHAKTREAVRAGLAMYFETADEPELVESSRALCAELGVDWFVNVQFIDGRLLEINPRISTIVYQEDFNMPYLAVRLALGEIDEDELAAQQSRVRMTRRAIRYYDQVEYDDEP